MNRTLAPFAFVALTLAMAAAGCFSAPETCSDCNSGAGGNGAGGFHGGGGRLGSGGTTTGAGGTTTGTGGAGGMGTGGSMSTGGTGMGGSNTGGRGAGGSGMGGSGMGGSGMGGSGMGGAGMGGAGMGGSGMGGAGMGGAGMGGAGGAIDVALVAWYKLDDGSGTTAVDSSGHGRNGTLSAVGGGTAAFSTTHQVGTGSLNLTSGGQGVGGLLTVPASLQTMGATTAITIACWVNVRNNRAWERIFDFGNSMSTGYMFLTAQQAQSTPNSVRFAISQTGNTGEQAINMTTPAVLSTGVWHHIAVTLGTGTTYTGTLYIDKAVAGTNTGMTLRPSSLGNTPNNWIGQSQFAVDPLFDGFIDDFRIYSRALSAAEIAALP
jgi:hypothetical protein